MGQGSSKGSGGSMSRTTLDAPASAEFVPTRVEINRCLSDLRSRWWGLQVGSSGASSSSSTGSSTTAGSSSAPAVRPLPVGVPLNAYGKQYAKIFHRSCGTHRADFKRCIEKNKFDLFNLAQWYPVCGEFSELEQRCSSELIKAVDRKCQTVLDAGADTLAPRSGLSAALGSSSGALSALNPFAGSGGSAQATSAETGGTEPQLSREQADAIGRCVGSVSLTFGDDLQAEAKKAYEAKKAPFLMMGGAIR
ncbi:unnamed protein product [Amoebophrya sp. A25]|nr:unnamed protein product [Amoebophrya sp. A25]|eukprot:GSA25T00013299001.1